MKIRYIVLMVLLCSIVSAYDLSEIEQAFVEDGEITCSVVVGDKGSSSEVLAQLDVINHLGKYSTGSLTGIGKLVSEIDEIYSQDLISIGDPCVNSITKDIMDYSGDCSFDSGLAKFYNKNGKVQLVVYGLSDSATRKIVKSIVGGEYSGEEKIIAASQEDIQQKQTEELMRKLQEAEDEEQEVIEPQEEPIPELYEEEPSDEPEEKEVIQVKATEEKKNVFLKIIDWFKGLFG